MTYTKLLPLLPPTSEIRRNPKTEHGWLIQIQPPEKPMTLKEVYVLPGRAQWGTKENPVRGRITKDGTTCIKEWVVRKGAERLAGSWGMYADDPLGDYRLIVLLDDRLAAEFKFRVVAE